MMGFLYPLLGLAALAAAVPVILHLIRRRDVRRLTFPAVRYLRRAERRHARRLRLRHLALLAARVTIILILAFAAMGPLLGRGGAADHRPTALAIVIDDSQSSARIAGDRRLLDQFVGRASLVLELATGDDRIALLSAVRPDRAAVSGAAAARAYLSDLQPTAGRADLEVAIERAHAWLTSVAEGRDLEIHVLTDLQAVSLPEAPAESSAGDAGAGIAALGFAPRLPGPANGTPGPPVPEVSPLGTGRHTTVSVPLYWYGPEPPSEAVIVRLVKGENVIAVAEGRFGSHALVRLPPQERGWIQGYVEIEAQGLAADDRRYFTWIVRPAARVAIVGETGGFLTSALAALEAGGRLEVGATDAAEVWLAEEAERIDEGLTAGRSVLVVPPASALDLSRLNSRLVRARIPWHYETDQTPGSNRLAEDAEIDGLGGLEVRSAYRLTPSGTASADTALLRLATGAPWLVRGITDQGAAYLLLASALTPEASDLPLSAAMVPFLDVVLGDWARGGVFARSSFDGANPVRLPARAGEVRYPDGSQATAEGGAWLHATQPGNYSALDGAETVLAFSVNAPIAEADLTRGSERSLESILPAADWHWLGGADLADWREEVFHARRGRLAWRPLVVILLVVSIVEASLAAAGRRGGERG
jgi:hypothetical protein